MALKQKLAELVVDITAKLEPLKGALAKARGVMKRGLASMVRIARRAAIGIGVALVAAFAWATKAAMVQEDAERELAAALRETGDATKDNIDGLKKYASELQEVTIYGDEQILSQMAYAKNLGVSTHQLKEAAKAAIGLAAKYKLELATAMMLVGRASQGQTQMLTRYGIVLDDTLSAQEKFTAVLKIGAGAFGLAEDAAKGTRGVLRQLWNVIGDVAERIAEPLLDRIKDAAEAIKEWTLRNEQLIATRFGEWIDAISVALAKLKPLFEFIVKRPKILMTALYALILLPFLPYLTLMAKGFGLLAKAVLSAKAAFALFRWRAVSNMKTIGKATKLQYLWVISWGRLRLAVVKAAFAFKMATVAGKAMMAGFFGLWLVAIGLAIKLLMTAVKWVGLLIKIRSQARGTTDDDIAAYKKEHGEAIKKAKARHAATKKQMQADKEAAKARKELERIGKQEVDKERLEAQLEFLEKVGSKHRDIAKLKRELLALEAKETAEKTGGDPREIRLGLTKKALALQAAADRTAADERRAEYRERLQTLKNLFTGEARYAKELSIIKKRLRHEEALDIKRQLPGLDLDAIKKMLAAKEAPIEIARAGLVGLQAAWGRIATGTQRTQEEQLRALVRIAESVERQEDIAEAGQGMQGMKTPRY